MSNTSHDGLKRNPHFVHVPKPEEEASVDEAIAVHARQIEAEKELLKLQLKAYSRSQLEERAYRSERDLIYIKIAMAQLEEEIKGLRSDLKEAREAK